MRCRYDWMCQALEEFKREFPGGRQHRFLEDAAAPVSEVTEHSPIRLATAAFCMNSSKTNASNSINALSKGATISWSIENCRLSA